MTFAQRTATIGIHIELEAQMSGNGNNFKMDEYLNRELYFKDYPEEKKQYLEYQKRKKDYLEKIKK